jgi:hypothetical protein
VTGAPQFVAAQSNSSAITTNGSVDYPAGIQANDVAIMVLNYVATSGFATFTDPSGWSNEFSQTFNTHSRQTVWSKRLTGSESGTVTITVSTGGQWTAQMVVYRGCKIASAAVENISGVSKVLTVSIAAYTAAPIHDITGPDRTVLHCHFATTGTGSQPPNPTPGTGYTQRSVQGASNNLKTAIHEKAKTTPGYENEVATYSSVHNDGWACIYLSLVPETAISSSSAVRVDSSLTSNVLLLGFNEGVSTSALADEASVTRTISRNGNAQITTTRRCSALEWRSLTARAIGITRRILPTWDFGSGCVHGRGVRQVRTKTDSQAIMGQWDNSGTSANNAWFFTSAAASCVSGCATAARPR